MTMGIWSRSGFRGCVLALVASVAFVAGCQRPKELRVPLDYRPTDQLALGGFEVPPGLRLAVTVVDARSDRSAIGRNSEGSPPVPIYPGDPAPDVFVRDAVAREFAKAGIPIENDPHKATKVLNLRLQRFWAEETNTYNTSIVADAELTDASGRRLWKGQVTANSERFGRSLSAENYQETFSDATLGLVQNLLHNPSFVEALEAGRAAEAPRPKRH